MDFEESAEIGAENMSIELPELRQDGRRPLLEVTKDAEEEQEEEESRKQSSTSLPPSSTTSSSSSTVVDPHLGGDGKKSSTLRAAANTVKSIVGVGILSFPYALSQAGLAFGLVSILLIAFLVNYTMRLLVHCQVEINKTHRDHPLSNYEDLARHAMGFWGYIFTISSILVTQIGICCAYVLFVASQLHSLPGLDVIALQLWAVIIAPVFVMLVCIRNMSHLAPFSAVGLLSVALAVAVVIYYGFSTFGAKFSQMKVMPTNYFDFLGIAVFGCEGINLAIPIHSNMEKPEKYPLMLNMSFLVIFTVFVLFSLLGYSFFLGNTAPIIVLNLPKYSWVVIVVKSALIVNVCLTFPVQAVPVISFMERLLFKREEHSCVQWRTALFWKRNALRFGLVVTITALSVVVPFFEVVINMVGGVGNGSSGFVIPAALYLAVFRGRIPLWSQIVHWGILVLGCVMAVLVTISSVMHVVQSVHITGNVTST